MYDDLKRLEDLCKDIVNARAGSPTKAQLWDCIERLGQEILVLRLRHCCCRDIVTAEGYSSGSPARG